MDLSVALYIGRALQVVALCLVGSASLFAAEPSDADPIAALIRPKNFAGMPEEQASTASAAFASADPLQRINAISGALSVVGISVIDSKYRPLPGTPDRAIALPLTHVMLAAHSAPQNSVPLADVWKAIVFVVSAGDKSAKNDANAFVNALRRGMRSDQAHVRFFANLVSSTNRRLGGQDLALPGTRAEDIRLDGPTVEILIALVLQNFMQALPEAAPKKHSSLEWNRTPAIKQVQLKEEYGPTISSPMPPRQAGGSPRCTMEFMTEELRYVLAKSFGGIKVADLHWEGLFERIAEYAHKAGELSDKAVEGVKKIQKIADVASGIPAVASAIYVMLTARAEVELLGGEPMVRTKLTDAQLASKYGGDPAHHHKLLARTISVTIKFGDESSAHDSGSALELANCLSMLFIAFGNSVGFPDELNMAGVEVSIEAGRGFDIVKFLDYANKRQQTADKDGEVVIDVQADPQPLPLAVKASAVDKDFSIHVYSTGVPIDMHRIVWTFLHGLICTWDPGGACLEAFAEILKTIKFGRGEWVIKLQDWTDFRVTCNCTGKVFPTIPICVANCPCRPLICSVDK